MSDVIALALFLVLGLLVFPSQLGWAGLGGAVPVVLATFPVIDGVPRSLEFFNIIVFAVLVSTVLQAMTIEPFARRLGLTP